MHRLLTGASALAFVVLAGCANTASPGSTVVSQDAQDAALIATGLASVLPSITSIPGADTATVSAAVTDLQAAATALAAADSAAASQAQVTRIETDVNAVVTVLAALPLPAPVSTVLDAAKVLLPVLEADVGLLVPVGSQLSGMSAAEARLVLRADGAPVVATPLTK